MRTTRHPIRHVLSLAGMGLMLAVLCGGQALPAAPAAGEAPFTSQHDQVS